MKAPSEDGSSFRADSEQSIPSERRFMNFVSHTKSVAVPHQIHTYSELRQQIRDDLPIQHPEWVEPNGESLMCLMGLLDSLTQRGIQRVYRYSSSRLRTGTKPDRQHGGVIRPEVSWNFRRTFCFTCCWHSQRSRLRHHAKLSTEALVGSTILHRNRRWIRGRTLFKETRQKECMLATSGNSVVQTEATGG